MSNIELKPACVFEQFARINQIPRPSKKEEKMIEFLREFGESRGLETKVDETGNVLIRKPATKGSRNLLTWTSTSTRTPYRLMLTASGCVLRVPHWVLTTA